MDGTLLNSEEQISNQSLAIINGYIQKGLHFTFATARTCSSALDAVTGLMINQPVIVGNGARVIVPATGAVLSSVSLSSRQVHFISGLLDSLNLYPLVFTSVQDKEKLLWVAGKESNGMKHFLNKHKHQKRMAPVKNKGELFRGDITEISCIGSRDELASLYQILRLRSDFACVFQQELNRPEYWCQIMPAQATKGEGIKRLREFGDYDQVIAFGDSLNDISMFQEADRCYAVENANPLLKRLATGLIGNSDHDGVARWILEHIELLPGKIKVKEFAYAENLRLRYECNDPCSLCDRIF